jgi:hypothetical protein
MPGLGLKNIAQGIGTKARNQIQLGKKVNVGRKINNSIQTVNHGIQTLTPLEKIPIIGTGVKVLTGVSGASAKISQFSQDRIDKRSDARSGNSLERSTVMPREEEPSQLFV